MRDLPWLRTSGPLWAGILVIVVLAFCPALEQPGRAVREALLLTAAPLLLFAVTRRCERRPATMLLVLLGWVTLAGLLGILRAPGPERLAVTRDLLVMGAPWIIAVCAALHRTDDADLDRWIERGAVVSLILVGALGLAQGWLGWNALTQLHPPAATFVNRNVAAQTLVILLPLALPAMLAARRDWIRWVSAIGVGLGIAFLIATRTRGAWLGAAFGVVVGITVWLVSNRTVRPKMKLGPLGVVAALAVVAVFVQVRGGAQPLPSVGSTLTTLSMDPGSSGAIRIAVWRNSLSLTGDHPWLGVGAGRLAVTYALYHEAAVPTPDFGTERQVEHAHNDLLEFAAELGTPSAVALALLLLGGAVLAFDGARRASTSIEAARWIARVVVIGGVAAHAAVSFPLHSPASAFLVWLVVGRCWSRIGRESGGTSVRRVVSSLALGAVFLFAWVGVRELRAQAALGDAVRGVEAQRCSGVTEAARDVHRLAPWRRREVGMAAMAAFRCEPDPTASLILLERAVEMHPNQLNLLMATGARRLKAGRNAEAAYAHATELMPSLGGAWTGLAMAQLARGDRRAAAVSCQRALRLESRRGPASDFCIGNGLAD